MVFFGLYLSWWYFNLRFQDTNSAWKTAASWSMEREYVWRSLISLTGIKIVSDWAHDEGGQFSSIDMGSAKIRPMWSVEYVSVKEPAAHVNTCLVLEIPRQDFWLRPIIGWVGSKVCNSRRQNRIAATCPIAIASYRPECMRWSSKDFCYSKFGDADSRSFPGIYQETGNVEWLVPVWFVGQNESGYRYPGSFVELGSLNTSFDRLLSRTNAFSGGFGASLCGLGGHRCDAYGSTGFHPLENSRNSEYPCQAETNEFHSKPLAIALFIAGCAGFFMIYFGLRTVQFTPYYWRGSFLTLIGVILVGCGFNLAVYFFKEARSFRMIAMNSWATRSMRNPSIKEASIISKASADGWLKWWGFAPSWPAIKESHAAASKSSVIDQMWLVIPAAIAGVERRVRWNLQ